MNIGSRTIVNSPILTTGTGTRIERAFVSFKTNEWPAWYQGFDIITFVYELKSDSNNLKFKHEI